MILGVVSDTHNRISNIEKIIDIFNSNNVDKVIHTGDITQAKSLEKFSRLNSPLYGVFGNNDLQEEGLKEISDKEGFSFKDPPFTIELGGRKIVILHEPDNLEEIISQIDSVDLIVHGHTHRYRSEIVNGIKIFNPGESAGILPGKNAVGLIDLSNLKTKRIFF